MLMLVNDEARPQSGRLSLTLEREAVPAARSEVAFEVAPLGQTTLYIDLDIPDRPGDYQLIAKADPGTAAPTLSRRKLTIASPSLPK